MTAPAPLPGGFDESEMREVLTRACANVGLDSTEARVLRGHTNAVILLAKERAVVKIARRGSRTSDVARTVRFTRWLMDAGFPTVSLYPVEQPVTVHGHAVTFWAYLPQPAHPVPARQLARPLSVLHTLPMPNFELPAHDNLKAIRKSLAAIEAISPRDLEFLSDRADRLENELADVTFELPQGVLQGDPQHRNALHTLNGGTVLCDWDTAAIGQPEWDLITVEVHCRRFGYGPEHYHAFAQEYGYDITRSPAYRTLRDVRELRMVATNARKISQSPGTFAEVESRINGLREEGAILRWNIL